MKPFDLEAAKRGEPLVTRDGRKARFIGHVPEALSGFRVVVFLEGDGEASDYLESGAYYEDDPSEHDLFMAPKKRTVWVNIYELSPSGSVNGMVHPTRESADCASNDDRIGGRAWPLEIEE